MDSKLKYHDGLAIALGVQNLLAFLEPQAALSVVSGEAGFIMVDEHDLHFVILKVLLDGDAGPIGRVHVMSRSSSELRHTSKKIVSISHDIGSLVVINVNSLGDAAVSW